MSEVELTDEILRQALQLQRLSEGEEARALAIMADLEADLRALLASGDLSEQSRRQINAILRDAQAAIRGRYDDIAQVVDTRELVVVIGEQTADAMAAMMPGVVAPSRERLASLADEVLIDGAPTAAWWARQSQQMAFDFAREVRGGVLEGATNEQIVARIFGRGDEPGMIGTTRRNVRALVHSSIMTAANRARLETYRKNARFTRGLRWVSALDSHTCITCMALDGKAWDYDGHVIGGHKMDFKVPPAHVNCRCNLVAIPKSLNAVLGTTGADEAIAANARRASSLGQIPATDFAGFLDRQTPAFVEEVLGTRRAEMWRQGTITLTQLVSGSGRPLTLSQIAGR